MRAEGLNELVDDLTKKSTRMYGQTMRSLWRAADEGARLASARVNKDTGETAETMSPGTFGLPGHAGVVATWGPTTEQGRLLETGTVFMGPFPYLQETLGAAAAPAIARVEKDAFTL